MNVQDIISDQRIKEKLDYWLLSALILQNLQERIQNITKEHSHKDSVRQFLFLSSRITVQKQQNVRVVSSLIHVKVGYDYKKIMKNSSIPPTVYPHQRDRTGVTDELADPKYVWQNVQTTMTLWVVFVI